MKNIKIPDLIKKFPPWQMFLFFIFVIYVIFPIPTPSSIAFLIDSSLGMIFIFCITLFLFLYTNPILAVTYIFVAYELLRRSSISSGNTIYVTSSTTNNDSSIIKYPKTTECVNKTININNISTTDVYAVSLEEEIIQNKQKQPQNPSSSHSEDSFIGNFNPLNAYSFMNATLV
jgi:hypothetical protein